MRMARGSPSRDCWRAVCMKSYRRRMLAIYLGLMLRCTRSRQHPHSSIAANSSQALYAKCTRRNSKSGEAYFPEDVDPTLGQPPVEKRHRFGSLRSGGSVSFSHVTPDGLFHRVLARVRGQTHQEIAGLLCCEKARACRSKPICAPLISWDCHRRGIPRIGRSGPGRSSTMFLADWMIRRSAASISPREDHLEMLCRLHSESYQPEQLYRELKPAPDTIHRVALSPRCTLDFSFASSGLNDWQYVRSAVWRVLWQKRL
jgi:hypothetical protein